MRELLKLSGILTVLCALFLTTACGNEDQAESVDLKGQYVHRDIFAQPFSADSSSWQKMYQSYGPFYKIFVEDILRIGPADSLTTYLGIEDFRNDEFQQALFHAVDSVYDEKKLSELHSNFEKAFGHWHALEIEGQLPAIYYFQGGLNFGILSKDSTLGVGLEWWLGKDEKLYQALAFPKYRIAKMNPEHLLPNAMKDWISSRMEVKPNGENMLHNLIYYGKVLYLTEQALPDTPDHEIMNLTEEQYAWFVENEPQIWETMATQDVLYGSRPFDIQKWFTDGPYTGPLPQDSPPMAGIYMGWQMAKDYMSSTESTAKELLNTSPETIITRYQPN